MSELGGPLTEEHLVIFDAVRRATVLDLSNVGCRVLFYVINMAEKGEKIRPHAEIASTLGCSVTTVGRTLRSLRDRGLLWSTPNGAGGATYIFGWDALAALAGAEKSRQNAQTQSPEPRQKQPKSPVVAVFSRTQEHDLDIAEDGYSAEEIETRFKDLKAPINKAGIRTNGYVLKEIRDFAADASTDFDAWEQAARICAEQGAKGFKYFRSTYSNRLNEAAAVADAAPQSEDAELLAEHLSLVVNHETDSPDNRSQGGAA